MKTPFRQHYKAAIVAGLFTAIILVLVYVANAVVFFDLPLSASVLSVIHLVLLAAMVLCWYYGLLLVMCINLLPTNTVVFKSLILHTMLVVIIFPFSLLAGVALSQLVLITLFSYALPLLISLWYWALVRVEKLTTMNSRSFIVGNSIILGVVIMNSALFALFI